VRVSRFLNLLAGLAILLTACAMFGAVYEPRLDLVTHFAYPLLLLALVCFVVSLCISRKAPGAQRLIAGMALVACLVLTGPELVARLAPRSGPAGEPQLRLMTYNLFWLNKTPDRARASVRESGADVVLLIEAVGRLRNVAAGLRDIYPYQANCPCGLSILSRWPIVDDYVRRDTRRGPQTVPAINWAVIDSPQGEITVMDIHLLWPTEPRLQALDQATLLKEAAPFNRRSLIIMGDFNSTPWSVFLRKQDQLFGMERRTRGLPTWPARLPWSEHWRAPFPFMPIDHVYAGKDWRTLAVRRGASGGSDHYPVIVTLSRKAED
jgi:endonuclease/exonuclease/phosphatase (EEP) superfamily protein YafD